jgi:hypothetical protein
VSFCCDSKYAAVERLGKTYCNLEAHVNSGADEFIVAWVRFLWRL